ncbi:MAG: hypothetical protein U0X93_09010 [Anaerolineales bacterium]
MKITSPARRLVRMAARSPAHSMAGPAVTLTLTPISLPNTCASVVLPKPGGRKIKHDPTPRAMFRRVNEDRKIFFHLILTDEVGKLLRTRSALSTRSSGFDSGSRCRGFGMEDYSK